MCKLHCRFFFMLIWVSVTLMAVAQTANIKFLHIDVSSGPTPEVPVRILKDKLGNIWVGAGTGLFRFDGTRFHWFKKSADSTGLRNNQIHDLCEDSLGNIWGVHATGIFKFNPQLGRFHNYSTVNVGIGPGMDNIECDGHGNIWAGGIPGLLRYNAAADSFERLKANPMDKSTLTIDRIRQNCMLTEDEGKGLWIATQEGLNYLDTRTGIFMNHKNQPESYLYNKHSIRALAKSPLGHYWMFDNNRQMIIGFKPGLTQPLYTIDVSAHIQNAFGATLFEDSQNRLWFADLDQRILLIDYLHGNKVEPVFHQPENPLSIRSNFFWDAFEDKDGTVWMTTIAGITTYNTLRDFYVWFPLTRQLPELKKQFAVTCLSQNPTDSSWWIGTSLDKAVRIHPSSGSSQVFDMTKAEKNKQGQMPGPISYITFLDNRAVFSTHTGSWQWAEKAGKAIPFNPLPQPYQSYKILQMVVQNTDTVWCTDYQTLLCWNRKSNSVQSFLPTPDMTKTFSNFQPISILRLSPGGDLWMHTGYGGFARFNKQKQAIETLPFNMPEEKRRSSYLIDYSFDSRGNAWFGYIGQGIYQYNLKQMAYRWWDDSLGVTNTFYSSAVVDHMDQVWGFQNNNVTLLLPNAQNLYQFKMPFGNETVSYVSYAIKLLNGHVLANIYGDLVEFIPEKVIARPRDAHALISLLEVNGTAKMIYADSLVYLQPHENFLTFRFGTLTPKSLFPHYIQFKLDGIDDSWRRATEANEAAYTQLPAGHYIFRVKITGNNNGWHSAEKTLHIIISNAFYKTIWFRLLMVAIACLLLYVWYRERMKQQARLYVVENKAQLLAKEKTQVQYENLKQHLNPHFLFNSLSSLSSLIEIDPKMAGQFLRSLSKTYRYILQSKDKETVPLGDEISFVQSFVALQQTRFEHGLQVSISIDERLYYKRIVPVTLQNLIENAIKHNIIDDENILVINIEANEDYLVVSNRMQLKKFVETSNKQGLESLRSLYVYLTDTPLEYGRQGEFFIVKIPFL